MGKIWKKAPGTMVLISRALHLFFSFGGCCRFEPTCSNYCAQSFRHFGVFKGAWLSFRRVIKCHPLGGHGFDFLDRKVG